MNWKLEIKNWKLTRRGFTIVELLVAMSLLVILLALSGMVFQTTVAAHRAAGATIDVTRNLRAVTNQLSADLGSLQKDAPLTIWFEIDSTTGQRYDQIQFFADDVFQSTKQYGTPLQTVYGNVARIYYGQVWTVDLALQTGETSRVTNNYIDAETLARRTHLFTSDIGVPPVSNDPVKRPFPDVDQVTNVLTNMPQSFNNFYEYDQLMTIGLWKTLLSNVANCDTYLSSCFNNSIPVFDGVQPDYVHSGRPAIDFGDIRHLHALLSQGVMQMRIQWAYTVEDLTADAVVYVPIPAANYFAGIRWWPSENPDADNTTTDSDFDALAMNNTRFGAYFEMPVKATDTDWNRVKLRPNESAFPGDETLQRCKTQIGYFRQDFYPKALKFTFTLKDSNGLFADGKTFTHIVYIDN